MLNKDNKKDNCWANFNRYKYLECVRVMIKLMFICHFELAFFSLIISARILVGKYKKKKSLNRKI